MSTQKLNKCYLIAEIGVNHGGSVEKAKELIVAAKQAGADAVKFQTFTAKSLVSIETPKVKYQESTTEKSESHYEMIRSLEFKREDHLPVINFCNDLEIDFISTPYDKDSAIFLHGLGVNIFKTASADIVDLPLHDFLASTGKKVIISTGMATLGEIDDVLNIYKKHGSSDIILLHCVSNYPCSFESLNLKAMKTLGKTFGYPVGYSDHAEGPYPAVLSIALGAQLIEKHFTLDKELPGPDHKASSTPEEFKQLVDAVRIAEESLGSGVKQVQSEELQMRAVSRKSIFLAKNISKGDIIKENDLTLKRPGTGIYSNYLELVVGKKACRELIVDEMLKFGDFSS